MSTLKKKHLTNNLAAWDFASPVLHQSCGAGQALQNANSLGSIFSRTEGLCGQPMQFLRDGQNGLGRYGSSNLGLSIYIAHAKGKSDDGRKSER